MDTTKVASAVRIGSALGSGAAVEWGEVFDALRTVMPDMCAVQVTGWDPVSRGFVVMAEDGYQRSISHDLAHGLPRTRWGSQLFDSAVPLLMDDMPHNFRDSPHYQERLRPAGFESGLSAALRTGGRQVVGVLHANAPVRGAFDEETRHFVSQVGTALARRVDPLYCPNFDAWFGPEWTASWLAPAHGPVSGRAPAPFADDPALRALADSFAALGVRTVPFLWPTKDGWYRVRLLRVVDGPRSGVVAACAPFENPSGLTARELDIATGLVAGLSNQAIAESLVVSRRTVETYVERLLTKLDCQSRGEAAGIAARAGFVRPSSDPAGVGSLARLTRGADPYWI
ncbi:LuxR C-terminal-related transcriptional regulator [Saccharothrix obliqua]|uniref:LuxR C-terminal-related transcriptional regulator n=1 Tax=Saccharothrix obliqua TaxID=2861747 RepID=UPI001C5D13FF|nr:LuxR C-terminal-related transcriptional regulator [Saccharothrix obliqua]MBW4717912.1 LuxR C-terminal-related transcriptional regulator [Saccharothrix obliqua]